MSETVTVVTRFQRLTTIVKDAVFMATLIASMMAAGGSLAIKLVWPMFIKQLKEDLNVATKEDLAAFQEQVNRIAGEDKIIRMPAGHSYVSEPVSQGEPIDVTLVLARTVRGQACIFVSGIPLYTDDRGIPFSGDPISPIKQVSTTNERLPLTLQPPAALNPGRVGISISMKFSCPFGAHGAFIEVYDDTETIFFQMDPAV